MALPADFDTVRVFGTFVDANGNAIPNGKVIFTATERLHSTAYSTVIIPSNVEAVPDSSGYIEVDLPCTDDPDIEPFGTWAWQVTEKFGAYLRRYQMLAPQGDAIDLTNVQPGVPPGEAPVNVLETVVGKHANAEGDIKIYLPDLTDTAISAPGAGQLLEWNGAAWTNANPPHGLGDLIAANNLSDVADAPTSRLNLGLRGASLLDVGTITGTVAAGDDSRITGAVQRVNNLSELTNITTARTNLGLGAAATRAIGTTAGTVPDGADSRITVTQDATVGNAALGTRVSAVETARHACYVNTTAQSIAVTANNAIQFPTARTSDSAVTPGGTGNSYFTLNTAGVWVIEADARFASAGIAGMELDIAVGSTFDVTQVLATVGATSRALAASIVRRFAAGTVININVYGGAATTLATGFGDANHVSFTRIAA